MMVGPEVRKYSGHPPWGSQGELQTCRAFIALLEQKRPDINQRVNLFSDFLEVTILYFLKFFRFILKFGYSEKATKFEKIFHIKFDFTE